MRLAIRRDVTVGNSGRLLHDVAELSSQIKPTSTLMHACGLDIKRDATQWRPCQTSDDSDSGQRLLLAKYLFAEVVHHILDTDIDRWFGTVQDLYYRFARDGADAFFEVTHARFTRITFDDLAQRALIYL